MRLLCLLMLMALARCGDPVINCDLTMVTQMPLQVQDRLLVVPAGIDGKLVHFVVDTGAERTTISDAVAERIGLPHDARYTTRSLGVGGTTVTTDVKVDRFVLGDKRFPVDRIAVGTFHLRTPGGLDADGLLGADILLAFDMDIDVPGGKLTLYRSRVCPDSGPPWSEPAAEVQGVSARRDRLLVPFELDGLRGSAILDTGAQRNVLGLDMARRLGLDEQAMVADPTVRQSGTGPSASVAHMHRFGLLKIGPTLQQAPAITVMSADAGFGDALIGEEWLQGRRVWLSFRNRQIFVSLRDKER
jgi:predicted aspartyl protease